MDSVIRPDAFESIFSLTMRLRIVTTKRKPQTTARPQLVEKERTQADHSEPHHPPPSSAANPHISDPNKPPAHSPEQTPPPSASAECSRRTIAGLPAGSTSPPTTPTQPDTASLHWPAHTAPQRHFRTSSPHAC